MRITARITTNPQLKQADLLPARLMNKIEIKNKKHLTSLNQILYV